MYRPTSNQSSLFELDLLFPDLFPKDDWCYIFRDQIYSKIDEDKFKHLYCEDNGAPNISIKLLITMLIFMGLERLTWRDVTDQFNRRMDWHIATRTAPGSVNFHFTTPYKFYDRLQGDPVARDLFTELTTTFCDLCGTSLDVQRTDTFFIHGWLQILSRYGLFKETIRSFLQNLRKQKPGLYKQIKGELSRDYLEKNFDLTEKDKDKAHREIKKMANDLHLLKKAFENHKQIKHYHSFQTLVTIFEQQCEVTDSPKSNPEVVLRETPLADSDNPSPQNEKLDSPELVIDETSLDDGNDVSSSPQNEETDSPVNDSEVVINETQLVDDGVGDTSTSQNNEEIDTPEIIIRKTPLDNGDGIISSPHNTGVRYMKKGSQTMTGDKGLVSETCHADNRTQFLTDANAMAATRSDEKELPDSHSRRQAANLLPEREATDAGFNTG
ncbi:MAG: hypothetical protein GY737_17535, partial [Desulfobacteraceae bacterium]|nr:hypothetical protein [Desulfobacteraceae bacterium]